MHILLIHQAFAALSEPGGTRHHEFARFLAGKGHKVSIITSPISYLTGKDVRKEKVHKEMDGLITIYRVCTYPALHKSFIHRLISFFSFMLSSFFISFRIRNVDIVWGTSPPIFQSFTAWLVSRLKRAPFLFEVRDLWPAFAIAVGVLKSKILIRLSLCLERFLYNRAQKIIVNSPGYIEHVRNKGGKNISLIPNSSDPSNFPARDINQIRKDLGWKDKFILLYSGAHGMSNDLPIILDAANRIRDHEEIKIVFIGDGKEKPNLLTLAGELQLTNVEFLDPVPKEQISNYILASDVCLAILKPIDLYKTTFPNKVFDYMAAGKPIILAIDGVIREVVESARCGIFCEPGDPRAVSEAIINMYEDRGKLSKMGQRGKLYLRHNYNRLTIAEELSQILDKLVENHG